MSTIKIKSLYDLKKWVNKLSDDELHKRLFYKSDEYSLSGEIASIEKSRADLLYDGEDDPAPLYTRTQLKANGCSKEEIEMMDIEIPKGSYVINI